jgi:meso-butanediol dehydrogenase/(S,S)-butanediol dehydrogenase/diacetyl reductase
MPRLTWTEMLSTPAVERGLDLPGMVALIPDGRMAKDEHYASLIAYLPSEEASHLTGQVVSVDGGQSLCHPLAIKV